MGGSTGWDAEHPNPLNLPWLINKRSCEVRSVRILSIALLVPSAQSELLRYENRLDKK